METKTGPVGGQIDFGNGIRVEIVDSKFEDDILHANLRVYFSGKMDTVKMFSNFPIRFDDFELSLLNVKFTDPNLIALQFEKTK